MFLPDFVASSVSDGDSIKQRKPSLLTKAAGSRCVAGFIIRTHFGEDTVTSSVCLQTSAAFHFLNFEVQFLPRYLWTQADYRQKHLVFPFLVGTIYNKHKELFVLCKTETVFSLLVAARQQTKFSLFGDSSTWIMTVNHQTFVASQIKCLCLCVFVLFASWQTDLVNLLSD